MVKPIRHVDVSGNAELLRLAEEVASTGESVVLQKDSVELATLEPATPGRKWQPKRPTAADIEAFRSAAGSWSDVDVDEFMKYVYEGRQSSKPPVDL